MTLKNEITEWATCLGCAVLLLIGLGTVAAAGYGICQWFSPPPGYDAEFPTRWLWEDFEDEFAATVKKAKEEKALQKIKAKEQRVQRKNELKALQTSIRAKLTPAELKAIRFK